MRLLGVRSLVGDCMFMWFLDFVNSVGHFVLYIVVCGLVVW